MFIRSRDGVILTVQQFERVFKFPPSPSPLNVFERKEEIIKSKGALTYLTESSSYPLARQLLDKSQKKTFLL